ncbi:hypothetical protein [Bacillus sp. JCM 19034]|uniref:hypothetical protein n=1 Tax=Bacillus sp. JCM 19034 TaxID=1481928 RepID=UPI0007842BF7|nr:hypothetical protein [Bacillus sp. JCM 19034]
MSEQEQELYMKYLVRQVLVKQLRQLKSDRITNNSSFVYLEHETLMQIIPLLLRSITPNREAQSQVSLQTNHDLKEILKECEATIRPIQQEFQQINTELEKWINE